MGSRPPPRRPGHCPALPAAQPAGALPDPGRHQRRAQRCAARRRHGLVADLAALQPAPGPNPKPGRGLNRAVAVAEVEGADAALTIVDGLDLGSNHLFHAIRADLLRRLGRNAEATRAYEAAIARTENAAERAFLGRRRQELTPA